MDTTVSGYVDKTFTKKSRCSDCKIRLKVRDENLEHDIIVQIAEKFVVRSIKEVDWVRWLQSFYQFRLCWGKYFTIVKSSYHFSKLRLHKYYSPPFEFCFDAFKDWVLSLPWRKLLISISITKRNSLRMACVKMLFGDSNHITLAILEKDIVLQRC